MPEPAWNILTIAHGNENVAAAFLLYIGVERYLPVRPVHYRLGPSRRRTLEMRPLFPGYLFVLAGHDRWGDLHEHSSIRGFLKNGDHPATLSANAIAAVRSIETELATTPQSKQAFDVGDTVRYCRRYWPFDGKTGVLRRLDKRDRAVIEIMLTSRAVSIETPAKWLKAVEAGPAPHANPL